MALDSSICCDGISFGMQDGDGVYDLHHSPDVLSGSKAMDKAKGVEVVGNGYRLWCTACCGALCVFCEAGVDRRQAIHP